MRNLIAFPVIGLAVILQSSVISQIKLLSGYADLPLIVLAAWALQDRVESGWHWAALACVFTGYASGMPWPVYAAGYPMVILLAQVFQRRIWQAPLLAMFSVTFAGTLFMHLLSFAVLQILGTPFQFTEVIGLITLPALLLNMLFAIPLFPMVRDLARWVHPPEEFE
jgi:rod shape-determining protein MreD